MAQTCSAVSALSSRIGGSISNCSDRRMDADAALSTVTVS